MLVVPSDFASKLPGNGDIFDRIVRLSGIVYRDVPGRRTLRVVVGAKSYFLKVHSGIGWKEIWKNLLQLKIPVVDARGEWNALLRIQQIGVAAPVPIAVGSRGWNPATRQSFLVTEDIGDSETVEEILAGWIQRESLTPHQVLFKRQLIRKVANYARMLHEHGINHRDLYLCHLRIAGKAGGEGLETSEPEMFIMDLHRAQIRKKPPVRWIVKDIGSLLYSSIPFRFTQRDWLRFVETYTQRPLRSSLLQSRSLWHKVQRRGIKMYEKYGAPQIEAGLLRIAAETSGLRQHATTEKL